MHVFLHIGSEKTGTTSIQSFFTQHAGHFARHGVLYPTSLHAEHAPRHSGVSTLALDGSQLHLGHKECGVFDADEIPRFREQFIADLQQTLSASPCERAILIDETCSTRLETHAEVARLERVLDVVADKVTVVLYVRNPIELAESKYATAVAGGFHVQFPRVIPASERRSLDQHAVARLWSDVFGRDNLVVRHYRSARQGGDSIEDFADVVGVAGAARTPQLERQHANPSIGRAALAFLVRFNNLVPPYLADGPNPLREGVVAAMRSYPERHRFRLNGEIAQQLGDDLREANEALIEEFLDGEPGTLLDLDLASRPDGDVPLPLHEDEAVRVAAHLWAHGFGAGGARKHAAQGAGGSGDPEDR